jgi:hypothetical protein
MKTPRKSQFLIQLGYNTHNFALIPNINYIPNPSTENGTQLPGKAVMTAKFAKE